MADREPAKIEFLSDRIEKMLIKPLNDRRLNEKDAEKEAYKINDSHVSWDRNYKLVYLEDDQFLIEASRIVNAYLKYMVENAN